MKLLINLGKLKNTFINKLKKKNLRKKLKKLNKRFNYKKHLDNNYKFKQKKINIHYKQ